MAAHAQITSQTGVQVYFADPHSPWQRGVNENTNGLLRDYSPKGTDLSVHPPSYLELVAAQMNDRPKKAWNGEPSTRPGPSQYQNNNTRKCCNHPQNPP